MFRSKNVAIPGFNPFYKSQLNIRRTVSSLSER